MPGKECLPPEQSIFPSEPLECVDPSLEVCSSDESLYGNQWMCDNMSHPDCPPVDQRTLDLEDGIVDGMQIDSSFCGCQDEMQEAIDWSRLMQNEYQTCGEQVDSSGNTVNTTGAQIEDCVDASLARQGYTTTVAGTTDQDGNVTIAPTVGQCGPLESKGTEIHEGTHSTHVKEILRQNGRLDPASGTYQRTPESEAVFNSGEDWWKDDYNAYGSEVPFYEDTIDVLNDICPP